MNANYEPELPAPGESGKGAGRWPDYRAVWRWHFYAGMFCIPFVVLLSLSGAVYLFRPQVERFLDRPYDHLAVSGPAASARAQAAAALAAVPGSTLRSYLLPVAADQAVRVLVGRRGEVYRVYVHPETLAVLRVSVEEDRPMRWIFRLHGELLLGNTGSAIVELAASWTIVMVLTGLFLWWPRNASGFAGIAWPRLGQGRKVFWRDLHAVTGFWISAFVLFLLVTGLPWAKLWGGYFKAIRRYTGTAVAQQDWTTGRPSRAEEAEGGEHAGHRRAAAGTDEAAAHPGLPAVDPAIDRVVAAARPLGLAPPVLVSPPGRKSTTWTAKSDSQNRPLRTNLVLDGRTGAVVSREDFGDRHLLDRMVGIGVAAHEGQLFGWPNQVLGVLTAAGLVLLSVSSVVLWWRRRLPGVLGAPAAAIPRQFSAVLAAVVLVLAVYLPLFAASLVVVVIVERLVLRRIDPVRRWLGLDVPPEAAQSAS